MITPFFPHSLEESVCALKATTQDMACIIPKTPCTIEYLPTARLNDLKPRQEEGGINKTIYWKPLAMGLCL